MNDDYPNIRQWLRLFPDERLAALQAHAEDGKFHWESPCSCIRGALYAPHPLTERLYFPGCDTAHYQRTYVLHGDLARKAEQELGVIAISEPHAAVSAIVAQLCREEFARREKAHLVISERTMELQ